MVKRNSILKEFFDFMMESKAYWMAPIIIILMLLVLVVVFGGTSAAPFIYTIF